MSKATRRRQILTRFSVYLLKGKKGQRLHNLLLLSSPSSHQIEIKTLKKMIFKTFLSSSRSVTSDWV